jgi:hypothetical protein
MVLHLCGDSGELANSRELHVQSGRKAERYTTTGVNSRRGCIHVPAETSPVIAPDAGTVWWHAQLSQLADESGPNATRDGF